jgi:hypothetical protein
MVVSGHPANMRRWLAGSIRYCPGFEGRRNAGAQGWFQGFSTMLRTMAAKAGNSLGSSWSSRALNAAVSSAQKCSF